MVTVQSFEKNSSYLDKLRQWPLTALFVCLILEVMLSFWLAGDVRLSMSYVSPSLIVLISFILWFRANYLLGMFGSALLGAFLLNSVVDGAFVWTLMAEGNLKSSWFSILVPSFHFLVAMFLLLSGRDIKLNARWLFAGCLAFFVLRALLLIPVYARWSGEIAGMTQNLSRWTGVKILPHGQPGGFPVESIASALLVEESLLDSCSRPNGETYNSNTAEALGVTELVWNECGFSKLQRTIESGENLNLRNDTEAAVQLRFSIYNIDSMNFEKTWNLVLFPQSIQVVSQFELRPFEVALVYSPDLAKRGVLALFPHGMRASLWVEHSPLMVRLQDSSR